MNAATKAMAAALAAAKAIKPTQFQQPMVPMTARLLRFGYEHDGVLVDLYGTLDGDGYDVEYVALHGGNMIDVGVWMPRAVLSQMSAWCDEHLLSAREQGLIGQAEDRAERMKWARNCGWIPP